jgi:ribonuclease HI
MNNIYRVYADGSAIGNPGPGGWAAIILHGRRRWQLSGGSTSTCISEMELLAALHSLKTLPLGSRVALHSDSQLLIRGMNFQVRQWADQQWKNRKGRSLLYREHWEELIALNQCMHIRWHWIRGHSSHPLQTEVDHLAYSAARSVWLDLKLAA